MTPIQSTAALSRSPWSHHPQCHKMFQQWRQMSHRCRVDVTVWNASPKLKSRNVTDMLLHIAHAPKGNPQETGGPGPMAPPIGVVAAGGIYTAGNWVSGQSSLHYIARALRSHALHAFQHPPLRRHALVTLGFRFEVSRLTLGSIPKLFPAKQGIQRRISRHTGNLGVAAFYCIQSNCPRVPQFFVSIG